jgi:hypothetical protein
MKKKVAVVSGPDNSKIINNKKDIVGNKSIFSILATIIYLSVHFMPDLGGADVMGAQWLFSGIVDLFVLFCRIGVVGNGRRDMKTQITWCEARALIALGIDVEEQHDLISGVQYLADEGHPTVAKLLYSPERWS